MGREQDEAGGGGGGRTRELAQFHAGETALLFNSGYDANYGLLSSLPAGADVVLYDELVHASVHDGMRAGRGRREAFRHNDVAHLRKILAQRRDEGRDKNGDAFVVVETVYSMDGDLAPLPALVDACEQFGAQLIVDEVRCAPAGEGSHQDARAHGAAAAFGCGGRPDCQAHATGVFGPNGAGCVQAHGLERRVFARVHTFGKALGVHGAAVLGSDVLRSYLINYARSLIYTTSLPTHSLLSIRAAYATMAAHPEVRASYPAPVAGRLTRAGPPALCARPCSFVTGSSSWCRSSRPASASSRRAQSWPRRARSRVWSCPVGGPGSFEATPSASRGRSYHHCVGPGACARPAPRQCPRRALCQCATPAGLRRQADPVADRAGRHRTSPHLPPCTQHRGRDPSAVRRHPEVLARPR